MRASLAALARAALALALALATGCDGFGLDPPSIVRTPRILAIVADPPESAPGTDITLSAITFDPEGRPTTLRWSLCIAPEHVADASGLPIESSDLPACVELATGDVVTIPGATTAQAITDIQASGALAGFPPEALFGILATAGLAFVVGLEVLDADGHVLVSGYKRVALTLRDPPTTNPPPISFLAGDVRVGPDTSDPFTCAPEGGGPLVVVAGEEIEIAPVVPEGGEDWLETFVVFDYTGGLHPGMENAYYSYFATGGGFSDETTRPPERETRWAAPAEPGEHMLWMIVRDGHLGTSGCRLSVRVE